jgi:hypothetical protein
MPFVVHALALAAAVLPVPGTTDFNGDGLGDVAQGGSPAGFEQEMPAPPWPQYVVFGKRDNAFVDVRSPGAWGAIVSGPYDNHAAPSVGDVNGDGGADL